MCNVDRYVELVMIGLQLRELKEFPLMLRVEDRLAELRSMMSPEDIKLAAIEVAGRSL